LVSALISLIACSGTDKATVKATAGGTPSMGGATSAGGGTSVGTNGGNTSSSNATGGALTNGGSDTGTGGDLSAGGGTSSTGGTPTSSGGFGGCGGTATLGTVTPAALYAELQQLPRQFLLINVHTPLAGNIPGTDADIVYTNVPAIEAFIGTDKSKPVVIYCMTDHMATIAGPTLVTDGYCNVRYLLGGLGAWQSAGYAVNP
jgi:rhodanese-related sulfurtransferase